MNLRYSQNCLGSMVEGAMYPYVEPTKEICIHS